MQKILSLLFILSIFWPHSFASAAGTVILPTQPIKILLVPGHDTEVWGAQYGTMKEATMTLALATKIFNLLKTDKRFEVHITRDGTPPLSYTKEFADYFANNQAGILAFKENAKKAMQNLINGGSFVQKPNVPHHGVTEDVALRLYGFNKWADENNVSAMIHIHFNDYPRPTKWTIGKYTGFAIYMPDSEFANSSLSVPLAKSIFSQLIKKYHISTYKPESAGIIPDQTLIAVGANDTLNASVRSVLIEYSYIYENKFRTKTARAQSYTDMANLTVAGIKNYFFP
jgi:N-acetylmuramoyl-L-alanine amidase